jgi:hypothetical protein
LPELQNQKEVYKLSSCPLEPVGYVHTKTLDVFLDKGCDRFVWVEDQWG